MKILSTLLLLFAFVVPAQAAEVLSPDPVVEARLAEVGSKLRCLVCQNQTIADSNADLAVDLRREIREQIAAGETDQQIIDYMVARYGDFVLYRPPFKTTTVLLWFGPALLLLLGVLVLRRALRARRLAQAGDAPLAPDDRRRAETLLAAHNEDAP